MTEFYASGLNDQTRKKMAELLNARLADMTALTLATKQAHWNVKGVGFIGFHELLDEVADRLRDGADMMAERSVILGHLAQGTLEVAKDETTVEPYPIDLSEITQTAKELAARYQAVGTKLRDAIETAAEAGDADTEDLFTEVSRRMDKDAWFVGAHAES